LWGKGDKATLCDLIDATERRGIELGLAQHIPSRYCSGSGGGRIDNPNTACQRRRSAPPDSDRTRSISGAMAAESTNRRSTHPRLDYGPKWKAKRRSHGRRLPPLAAGRVDLPACLPSHPQPHSFLPDGCAMCPTGLCPTGLAHPRSRIARKTPLQATEDIDGSTTAVARSNAILGTLSAAAVARLFARACEVAVGAGEVLVRQGERSDCAYLILDGDLEVQVNTAYGEVLVAQASKGALIGEIGVFADLPRIATVRARTDVRALRFDRAHLLEAGDSDPALLHSVITRLGGQIARLDNAIGLYTKAVSALEQDKFDPRILDELREPGPELLDFAQHFRRMAEQIVERRAQEAEMASAAAIQRAMLPAALPKTVGASRFDVFAHMVPAREVGGDLYDIVDLGGNRIAITIGDVCGKGVPASLFMAVTQTVMRLVVRSGENLEAEIGAANNLLVANNREDMFATFFCGVLDLSSGAMTYCNCGHNPPLVLRKDARTCEALRPCGPPLAVAAEVRYLPQVIMLEPRDVLTLYTDGVTEAEDVETARFSAQRLEQAICEMRHAPARTLVEHLFKRVAEFANGAPQSDDITCIAVVRNER